MEIPLSSCSTLPKTTLVHALKTCVLGGMDIWTSNVGGIYDQVPTYVTVKLLHQLHIYCQKNLRNTVIFEALLCCVCCETELAGWEEAHLNSLFGMIMLHLSCLLINWNILHVPSWGPKAVICFHRFTCQFSFTSPNTPGRTMQLK